MAHWFGGRWVKMIGCPICKSVIIMCSYPIILRLEILMEELACVGSCWNASTTAVLTNEAQPPQCFILPNQEAIVVKGNAVGHEWLACILSAGADGTSTLDIGYHVQAPWRAFFANEKNLCDRKVRFPPFAAIFAWPLWWTILGLAHTLVAHIVNSNPPNYRTKRTAPSFCKQTFVHGKVASPKNIAGNTTASNDFSRKTAKICLFHK